ncbi:MAG TPA: hypothetical protein VFQ22_10265 [Longimicrobiales bacterium]|nr:hypothetical protein [Longimicrobiales bacterium]
MQDVTAPDPPGMWQQFRRRRVIRTVLLYLMVAFGLSEITLFVAPALALPEWAVRAVFGVLVLGFPATVVLAWTYDVTPEGIVRTPDEEEDGPPAPPPPAPGGRFGWLLGGGLALLVGLVLRLLRT